MSEPLAIAAAEEPTPMPPSIESVPIPEATPSDDGDVVVKPKKKYNISEERRQQLRERMKVVAAERLAKLRGAREQRIKEWNQDPPPKPCHIGKGKYKHKSKPVEYADDESESSEDDLPDPNSVLNKQKDAMVADLRDEEQRREYERKKKVEEHNKAVAKQLREDKKREAEAKKAYEEQVLNLRLEREKLEMERKEFEERLVKEKAGVRQHIRQHPEYRTTPTQPARPTPVAVVPTPSAPLIRGKFIR
jgi:hypothetical protein